VFELKSSPITRSTIDPSSTMLQGPFAKDLGLVQPDVVEMPKSTSKEGRHPMPTVPNPPGVIIAIDPGGTTGVAWWTADGREVNPSQFQTKQIGPCTDDAELWYLTTVLGGIIRSNPNRRIRVIGESFDFRMEERYRDKIDYTAAEVIGALRLWHHPLDQDQIFMEFKGAGLGKGFWSDEKIKKIGLWRQGQRHAMDAMRHLLRYMAFQLDMVELFEPFRPPPVADQYCMGADGY
jgi:hypothetical protein